MKGNPCFIVGCVKKGIVCSSPQGQALRLVGSCFCPLYREAVIFHSSGSRYSAHPGFALSSIFTRHVVAEQFVGGADIEASPREDGEGKVEQIQRRFPDIVRLRFTKLAIRLRRGFNEP